MDQSATRLTLTGRVPTQGVTETFAAPLMPDTDAVIVAPPGIFPVTVPSDATLATASLLLDQVNVLPAIAAPLASRALAVNRIVWPTRTVDGPVTATDATAAGCVGALSDEPPQPM